MDLYLLNANIVVLAEGHNPTILNPHFLQSSGIVPRPARTVEGQVFMTPALSHVLYEDGLEFTVQGERLQIAVTGPTFETVGQSELPDYALRYLEMLPHVRYTAVGVNLLCVTPGAVRPVRGVRCRSRHLRAPGDAENFRAAGGGRLPLDSRRMGYGRPTRDIRIPGRS
jgi:hypothetical protein